MLFFLKNRYLFVLRFLRWNHSYAKGISLSDSYHMECFLWSRHSAQWLTCIRLLDPFYREENRGPERFKIICSGSNLGLELRSAHLQSLCSWSLSGLPLYRFPLEELKEGRPPSCCVCIISQHFHWVSILWFMDLFSLIWMNIYCNQTWFLFHEEHRVS